MAKSRVKAARLEEEIEPDHREDAPEAEAEEEGQDHNDEASAAGDAHDVDTSNKASLVRAALAAGHTKPQAGCRWIKETYGVDVPGTYFSVAKSQQAKRSGDSTHPRANPPAARHQTVSEPALPLGVPAGFGGDVKAIRVLLANHKNEADAVKDLVATVDTLVRKYGVSGLNEMIDAFSE